MKVLDSEARSETDLQRVSEVMVIPFQTDTTKESFRCVPHFVRVL